MASKSLLDATTYNTSQVSSDQPWLGLRAFTEDVQDYFFGREEETQEIYERILHRPLTVVFGQSGLGKTSLLRAGLIPKLKKESFVPIYIRLDYDDETPLEYQIIRKVFENFKHLSELPDDVGLWQLFHDEKFGFVGDQKDSPLLKPVLIFDQFEEIFTQGEVKREQDAVQVMRSLATLVENRVPEKIRLAIDEDEELFDRLDFDAQPVRVLISLRNDFLHRLERWHSIMPSMMENRFELRLLSGPQAFLAVREPARKRMNVEHGIGPILNDLTAKAIVRFVADSKAPDQPLDEIFNVPPFLSLICQQLNERRLANSGATIDEAALGDSAPEVLQEFFKNCFAGLPNVTQTFVEEELISPSGYRESVSWDDAAVWMSSRGVKKPSDVIKKLVTRRLLTAEERNGTSRIELTHDILAPMVINSRDERRKLEELEAAKTALTEQKEQTRTQRKRALILLTLSLLSVIAAFTAIGFGLKARAEGRQAEAATHTANAATLRAEAAYKETSIAYKESKRKTEVASETVGLFADVLTSISRRDELVAAEDQCEVLTRAYEVVRKKFDDQPLERVRLLDAITAALLAMKQTEFASEKEYLKSVELTTTIAQESLATRQEQQTESVSQTSLSSFNLARALARKAIADSPDLLKQAIEQHESCLNARSNFLGEMHPLTFESKFELALLIRDTDSKRSLGLLTEYLDASNTGLDETQKIKALFELGSAYEKNKNYGDAMTKFERSIEIGRVQHIHNVYVILAKRNLALLHQKSNSGISRTLPLFIDALKAFNKGNEDRDLEKERKELNGELARYLNSNGLDPQLIGFAISAMTELEGWAEAEFDPLQDDQSDETKTFLRRWLPEKSDGDNGLAGILAALEAEKIDAGKVTQLADWLKNNLSKTVLGVEGVENCALLLDELEQGVVANKYFDWVVRQREEHFSHFKKPLAISMGNLAWSQVENDQGESGRRILERAKELAKNEFGTHDQTTLMVTASLGIFYQRLSKHAENTKELTEKAIQAIEEAYQISCKEHASSKEGNRGPLGDDSIRIQNRLFEILRDSGKHKDAMQQLDSILVMQKEKFGDFHPHPIITLRNKARLYVQLDQSEKAIRLRDEAMQHLLAQPLPNNEDEFDALEAMANWLYAEDELESEIKLLQRQADGIESAQGLEDSKWLETINSLSISYRESDRYWKALELLESTVNKLETQLGKANPQTLEAKKLLGIQHLKMDNTKTCLDLFVEIAETHSSENGVFHEDTTEALSNVFTLSQREESSELEGVVEIFRRHSEEFKIKRGVQHTSTVELVDKLAKLLVKSGKKEEAFNEWNELIEQQINIDGPNSAASLMSLNRKAILHENLGEFSKAIEAYRAVVAGYAKNDGPDATVTLQIQWNLADAYQNAGRKVEATPLLRELFTKMLDRWDIDDIDTVKSLNSLAHAYLYDGREIQAEELLDQHYFPAIAFLLEVDSEDEESREYREFAMRLSLVRAKAWLKTGAVEDAVELLSELHDTDLTDFVNDGLKGESDVLWAEALIQSEDFEDVIEVASNAHKFFKDLDEDSGMTHYAATVLGQAHAKNENYGFAEKLLLSGVEGLLANQQDLNINTRRQQTEIALKRIVELYTAWEKPEKAKPWQKKLDELPKPKETEFF